MRTRLSQTLARGGAPPCLWRLATPRWFTARGGISPLRSGKNPHSGRNDIINQADKKPSPLGARRFIRSNIITQTNTDVISSVSREIPYNRNGTLHIRASPLARGGAPPRNPLRQKRNNRTRLPQRKCPRQPTRRRWLTAEKSPAVETRHYAYATTRLPTIVPCR